MSRSKRKIPISGWTAAKSEAQDKQIWHQRMRSAIKNIIRASHNDVDVLEDTLFPTEKDVSNVWAMDKDGKHYVNPEKHGLTEWFKKLMRK